MIENGVYIIKDEYFKKFQEKGSKFKDNKSGKRLHFVVFKISMRMNCFGQYQLVK